MLWVTWGGPQFCRLLLNSIAFLSLGPWLDSDGFQGAQDWEAQGDLLCGVMNNGLF